MIALRKLYLLFVVLATFLSGHMCGPWFFVVAVSHFQRSCFHSLIVCRTIVVIRTAAEVTGRPNPRAAMRPPGSQVKRKPLHYHERIRNMDAATKAKVRALRVRSDSSSKCMCTFCGIGVILNFWFLCIGRAAQFRPPGQRQHTSYSESAHGAL